MTDDAHQMSDVNVAVEHWCHDKAAGLMTALGLQSRTETWHLLIKYALHDGPGFVEWVEANRRARMEAYEGRLWKVLTETFHDLFTGTFEGHSVDPLTCERCQELLAAMPLTSKAGT